MVTASQKTARLDQRRVLLPSESSSERSATRQGCCAAGPRASCCCVEAAAVAPRRIPWGDPEESDLLLGELDEDEDAAAPLRAAGAFRRRSLDASPLLLPGVPPSSEASRRAAMRCNTEDVSAVPGMPPQPPLARLGELASARLPGVASALAATAPFEDGAVGEGAVPPPLVDGGLVASSPSSSLLSESLSASQPRPVAVAATCAPR